MKDQTKVELLAPAGNAAAFYGAVRAGADAVYLAGERFGARAYAENFTAKDLIQCIRYAHLFGRRVYLAVNTLFKEHELKELSEYLEPFYEAGLDAVIVQDLGVLRHIREHFPGMGIHASTQMTLCSGYGAALLKRLGADRIVPARELSLQELTKIKQAVDIELETFIHGAMCYCYSGQCLFSSILGGRSGNRGRCAQPCRLPYSVACEDSGTDKAFRDGECYPLSLKDMCTVLHIPELIEARIDSFKIEGRMKRPEYAAGVTAVYRKYIDRYYQLRQDLSPAEAAAAYRVEEEDFRQLTSLYIRSEVQDGYYFRYNGREMMTLDSPAYSGSDEAMLAEISAKYLNGSLKYPVAVNADFQVGKPAMVSLCWKGLEVSVTGEVVAPAKNQPITEENVKKQLGKLGESCFEAEEMQVSVSENAFYPLKQINELRRRAVEELEQQLLEKHGYSEKPKAPEVLQECGQRAAELGRSTAGSEQLRQEPGWAVSLRTVEQLGAIRDWVGLYSDGERHSNPAASLCRIYVEGDLLIQHQAEVLEICKQLEGRCRLWITLPYIVRQKDSAYMEQLYNMALETGCFQGFLARSLDEIGFFLKKGAAAQGLQCRADAGVYTWNREAFRELQALGVTGFCLPYELKAAEQRSLLRAANADNALFEKIVYSRIPMMITANCVQRTAGRCKNGTLTHREGGEVLYLTDRYRKKFPVLRNCLHCMNIIYNSVPFSLYQEHVKWEGIPLRIDLTLESAAETERLLKAFLRGEELLLREYTTGHEKRGVE